MKCAVADCRSDNRSKASNCSFYIFPSHPALARKWVQFCRREDYFNPKTSFICMKHFKRDDFGNSLQYEMGYARNRLLNRGVVPSIYEDTSEEAEIRTTIALSPRKHTADTSETLEPFIKENMKIINLVKINPLVYTSISKKERQEIWKQIDKACGFKNPQSRKRWERLLSDFCLHILNVTKKTQPKDGLSTSNKKTVKFQDYCYFKDMLFILPFIKSIVGNANLSSIQEKIKNEGMLIDDVHVNINMETEVKLELETDPSEDIEEIAENNEIPSTSKSPTVTARNKAHRDYETTNHVKRTPIEIKIDNNVYQIEMSTSEDLETPNCDFKLKEHKNNTDRINTQKICSTNTTTYTFTTMGTMTDRKPVMTPYENLTPEEKSLKAFFDAMLHATQRLPEFHQRRIKGDLVKALRHQGVDITD
uniref:THAP domain-containing protein 2 n=2 Tax=Zeugodacus cucurbitae TaxID=28588 RepID=A0A0A1XFK1_ZEUCU